MEVFIRICMGFGIFIIIMLGFGYIGMSMDSEEGGRFFIALLVIAIILGVLFGYHVEFELQPWEAYW